MCHISFQQSLPTVPGHGVSHYWENQSDDVHYYAEPAVANLDDSLQYYEADDGYEHTFTAKHGRDDQCPAYQTEELFPSSEGMAAPWLPEDDAELMDTTSYPSIPCRDSDIHETDTAPATESYTEFYSSSLLPTDHSVQEEERHVLETGKTLHPLLSTNQQANSSTHSTDNLPESTISIPPLSATMRMASQKEVRSSAPSKLSTGSHHTTNISREYYGNGPVPPRLLTSGMVRRTPSRQPIKSLDLDIASTSTSKGPQPHFQANDRAAALQGEGNYDQEIKSSVWDSFPGGSSSDYSQRKRVDGLADLMAFHSRQSGSEGGREGGILTSNVAIKASTMGRISRPKV